MARLPRRRRGCSTWRVSRAAGGMEPAARTRIIVCPKARPMLSLVLPTYNEAANLGELVPRIQAILHATPHEIIVVDDDSPDRTWETALRLARELPELRVIRRIGRRGLSSAVIEGFLAATGEVLAVADADGQHDYTLLPRLYQSVRDG